MTKGEIMKLKENQPQIYIICGKARNGKDTIADMIKEIYKEKIKIF